MHAYQVALKHMLMQRNSIVLTVRVRLQYAG
jgi:hypothetical protein